MCQADNDSFICAEGFFASLSILGYHHRLLLDGYMFVLLLKFALNPRGKALLQGLASATLNTFIFTRQEFHCYPQGILKVRMYGYEMNRTSFRNSLAPQD